MPIDFRNTGRHGLDTDEFADSHGGLDDQPAIAPGKVPLTSRLPGGMHAPISRKVSRQISREKGENPAGRNAGSQDSNTVQRAVDSAEASPSRGLEPGVRGQLERSLGTDLGSVRVHDNPASAGAARDLGAKAFTYGQNIHFGAGQYDPSSKAGQSLIAHEVAHTVQQRGAAPASQTKLEVSEPGDSHELEADRFAADFISGRPSAGVSPAPGSISRKVVQRLTEEVPEPTADALAVGIRERIIAERAGGGTDAVVAAVQAMRAQAQGVDAEAVELAVSDTLNQEEKAALNGETTGESSENGGEDGQGGQNSGGPPAATPGGPNTAENDPTAQGGDGQQGGDQQAQNGTSAQPEGNQDSLEDPAAPEVEGREPGEERPQQTEGEEGEEEGENADGERAQGDNAPGGNAGDQPPAGDTAGPGGPAGQGGPGGQGGPVTIPQATGDVLPPWEQVKSAFPWDQEIAQHDVFKQAAAEIGAGGGGGGAGQATARVPSREELVTNALTGGAWTGFTGGLKSVAIDTVLNVAGSKIPYLSGFVEIGNLVYKGFKTGDWAAGFKDLGAGLIGSSNGKNLYAEGIKKLVSGDPLDMLEGLVDLGSGIKSTIDTLSSICWIVAGLGFILSWIPGMQWLIPFVALAAKWGSVLGMIGTVMGAVLSMLRMVLIPLRAADILYWESDPAAAAAKAERLQQDTQAFVQTWTERAGDTARKHVAGQPHRNNAGSQPQRSGAPAGQRPSGLQRAMNFAGGAFMTATGAGQFSAKSRGELSTAFNSARQGTSAAFQGGQTTGQRINAVESAGVDVYVSQGHRDAVNKRLGPENADPASDQGRRGQAQQRLADAEADLQRAKDERTTAREDLRQRERDLRAAEDQLRSVRAENAPARSAQERKVREAQELADSYQKDIRSVEVQRRNQQEVLDMARSAHQTMPDGAGMDGVPYATKVQQAEAEMTRLDAALANAQSGHREAVDLHQQEVAELGRVTQVETDAQTNVDTRRGERNQANTRNSDAAQDLRGAHSERRNARREATEVDAETADARKNFDERMDNINNHVWWRDVGGAGADGGHLYGHNQGSGVTGFATGTGVELFDKGVAAATGGGEQKDYAQLIRDKIAEADGALEAPPLDVPDRVDGAVVAMEELVSEEQALNDQQQRALEAAALGTASLQEMEGVCGFIEGGRSMVEGGTAETETLQGKQDELSSKGDEISSQAGEAASKSGEGQGHMSSFIGPFMDLMGRIPDRFVSNAGAGSQGAQNLQSIGTQSPETAQMAQQTGQAATAKAGEFRTQTEAARGQLQGVGTQLDTAQADVEARQVSAEEGLTETEQAQAEIEAELALIESEKQRVRGEHQTAAQQGADWATTHQSTRTAKMSELEALVAEAEAAQKK